MDYTEYNETLFENLRNKRKQIILDSDRTRNRSIFGITESGDKTYRRLLDMFELETLLWSEGVSAKLCEEHNIEYAYHNHGGENSDISIKKDDKLYNITFKSGFDPNSSFLHRFVEYAAEPCLYVMLVDDSDSSHQVIDNLQKRINQMSSKDISVISYHEYIRLFFGEDEVKKSEENNKIIKKKARDIIAQKVTDICTEEQRKRTLAELEETIKSFDYKSLAEEYGVMDNIYPDDFELIKENFLDQERYCVLLGDKDFAESLFSSEWLYQNSAEEDGITDNTYKVTGYIKSIEQLLWGIVFIIGEGRSIGRNNITINGDNSIRTTLEDFCYFINSYRNRNLCDDIFELNHASSLMEALHDSIEDYKNNCRNGYLHKHNVEAQDVSMIRKKTFLLYFLLLGILKISDDDIIALGGTK